MPLPSSFEGRLSVPAVAAPMFLASGPELIIETCKAGIVGGFPALNQRSSEGFEQWLIQISEALAAFEKETGRRAAPYGVNLIVNKTNPRLQEDLALCVKHKVPLIITSMGAAKDIVDAVHGYGGVVFHDVVNPRHAQKAAATGVDGLILVCAGAGGHAGSLNPFALVNEVRQFFDKTILLSGALSTGSDVAAAQMMGADLAYMGSRFLATQEALVGEDYKAQLVESIATDILYTPKISGVPASFIRQTLEKAGLDIKTMRTPEEPDFGLEMDEAAQPEKTAKPKPWRDLWSAGQGVGSISDIPATADLVARLVSEYQAANRAQQERFTKFSQS
tara:strand:+ start:5577 stop:6578 length:1002 start_codon:yes stop_codon:yes gene_type:complete